MESALMYYVYATIIFAFQVAWKFPRRSVTLLTSLCTYSWATSQSPWRLITFLWTRPILLVSMISYRLFIWAMYILMAPLRLLIPKRMRAILAMKTIIATRNGCNGEECSLANCTCKGWKVVTVEALMPNLHSVAIPTTQKKNVVAFTYSDGQHCGYGSFVTLTSGRRGLATVKHVWDSMVENAGFASGRKGKVPVSIFKPLYVCPAGDIVVLTTSKANLNWSSLIGVKACKMLPITDISLGTHRLEFANEQRMWFTQACTLLGLDGHLLRIRSNTEAGFSGLPLYDNKGRIVALHQGNVVDYLKGTVENRAAFLYDIPGITGPLVIPGFESVYEDRRVLHGTTIDTGDFELCDVEVSGRRVVVKVTSSSQYKPTWKPTLTGKVKGPSWADMDDEDSDEYLDNLTQQYGIESLPLPKEKDQGTLIKELQAEIENLKLALRIKIQESSPPAFKRGHPEPTGKSNGRKQEQDHPYNSPQEGKGPTNGGGKKGKKSLKEQSSPRTGLSQAVVSKESRGGLCAGKSSVSPTEGDKAKAKEGGCANRQGRFNVETVKTDRCGSNPEGNYKVLYGAETTNEKTPIEAQFEGYYNFQTTNKFSSEEAPAGFKWAGKCRAFFHASQAAGFSKWGQARIEASVWLREKVAGFGWPRFGAEAELKSLRLQAERRFSAQIKATVPTDEKRRVVIKECVSKYQHTRLLCPDWIRNGFNEAIAFRTFLDCVEAVSKDSGSGIPYASLEGRRFNESWINSGPKVMSLWELVRARLLRMLSYEFISPEQAVSDGVVDPVRVFVKGEPHKLAKLAEGRYRLIASVSLVDQLVARMLFQEQNKCELSYYRSIPSQPGLGLSLDEQVEEFVSRLSKIAGAPDVESFVSDYERYCIPTDCSGFDWSVPMWLLEDDMVCRNQLTSFLSPEMEKLRGVWLKCLTNSVFCLSDGTLLSQTLPGLQKSGSYNTSSSNSRMRVLMSLHAGASWCVAMGDDAVEAPNSNLSKYAELGFKCEQADKFDFCSHVFHTPQVAIPANVGKMLLGLLSGVSPESPAEIDRFTWLISCASVIQELRHLPSSDIWNIYSALSIKVCSEQKSVSES
nr:putative RNA-dependent RNA polymerase P1-P2 fusion protein [Carrot enamovirus 1]